MLVLSRGVGEKIVIGDDITITVVRIGPNGVRIGIDAPGDVPIVREELIQRERDVCPKCGGIGGDRAGLCQLCHGGMNDDE